MFLFSMPDTDIPTVVKYELIFHTAVASWVTAESTCKSYGGHLLQLDSVAKRHMLQR